MRMRVETEALRFPPCEGATTGTYLVTEKTTRMGHPEEYWWYSSGIHHLEEDGVFLRDQEKSDYFVTISDLHDLDTFIQTNGAVKILPDEEIPDALKLVILA